MPATILNISLAVGQDMFSNCPSLKEIVLNGPKPPRIEQYDLNDDGIGFNFVVRSLCESTAKKISANPDNGYTEYGEADADYYLGGWIPDNPDTGDYSTCVRGEAAEMVVEYAENNNLCDTLSVCPDFDPQPEVLEVKVKSGNYYIKKETTGGWLWKPVLYLDHNKTYVFDQTTSSNDGHPLGFYRENNNTLPGYQHTFLNGNLNLVSITVDCYSDVTELWYACKYHQNMGNKIIFNPCPLPDDLCQVGDSFDGEVYDQLGMAVDVSNEGNTIAILEHGDLYGKVKVFEFENNTWGPIGDAIVGAQLYDYCGNTVSLSKKGSIVAFGCSRGDSNGTNSGHAEVWQFNDNDNTWVQLGQRITGYSSSYSGQAISLSSDGLVIAIGGHYLDSGNKAGLARVYRFEDGAWGQRGQDLWGEDEGDRFGTDLSLSSDGTMLAVGAPNHPKYTSHGRVRVFQYGNTGTWNQLGLDIEGSNDNKHFGSAVSLSGDGATIAIGEQYKTDDSNNHIETGAVYVYEFLNENWELKGDIIHGLYVGGRFGHPVSLSQDGQTVVSMGGGGDFNGTDSGQVMLHRYVNGEWVQIGKSIGGNAGGGNGGQVAMSGNRIIVGFPSSTEKFNGEVDVYELCHEPTNEPPRSPEDGDGGSDEGLGIIILASVGSVVVVGGAGLYFYMSRGAARVAHYTKINLGELIY